MEATNVALTTAGIGSINRKRKNVTKKNNIGRNNNMG